MTAEPRTGGGGDEVTSPAGHTTEWLDTYLAQATKELIAFAARYAHVRARKVALVRHVDGAYVDNLVEDILADTFLGVIAWDPERVSLKKHVLDAIKSRTRHDYVHALKFRTVRIDDRGVLGETELSLAQARERDHEVSHATAASFAALRELANGDRDVMLLLDAFEALVTKKRDIMKRTGLTHKRYDAARKRLGRLTRDLPQSLLPE